MVTLAVAHPEGGRIATDFVARQVVLLEGDQVEELTRRGPDERDFIQITGFVSQGRRGRGERNRQRRRGQQEGEQESHFVLLLVIENEARRAEFGA